MAQELKYSIDIAVNRVLSETEKNKLILALSKAVEEILGKSKSGTVMIYSERKGVISITTKKREA